jgi:predicted secreted hydrolase
MTNNHLSNTAAPAKSRRFWNSALAFVAWLSSSLSLLSPAAEPARMRVTAEGFAIPQPGRKFEFPRDHGSHPEFKIEWWYVTGHLFTESQARYGFQATFFRSAGPPISPDATTAHAPRSATFGVNGLYLAHIAISDVNQQRFLFEERLNREGWDASAERSTLAVRNGNWSLTLDTNQPTVLLVQGSIRDEASFVLQLRPQKPLVIFGEDGVSRKGADPSASSHYLTFSRLAASGTLTLNGRSHTVKGQAWMDHEISSSQLDQGQEGWDWASIQLRDGREVMVYRLRLRGGATDPHSQLAWVDDQGMASQVDASRFTWTTIRQWKSPQTGGLYPVSIRLETIDPATHQPQVFLLEPVLDPQELDGPLGGIPYWEGACRVRNPKGEDIGSAYLELTGYVGNLAERFR